MGAEDYQRPMYSLRTGTVVETTPLVFLLVISNRITLVEKVSTFSQEKIQPVLSSGPLALFHISGRSTRSERNGESRPL